MKFEITIIFVTLVILVTTLLLNSALSLASFEKIYVRSLVSTYELTGKNLKRKIEPSLRFGKPLENFKGMERFLAEVMENTPGLSYAGIVSPAGKILHHTDKSKAGELLALPVFDEKEQVHSSLVKGSYLTFLPLYNRAKKTVGFIYLSFSRDVIYQKLKLMAAESLNVLWLLLLSTSLGLILLLAVWIVQPIRRELTGICEVLKHAPEVLPAN
ncbi:MAG: hypothetical protein GY862_35285, partial [Gammaproteobacteria bacterium]|nr:hypothetical protein [Gammaproteobacteria bacterium]